MLTWRHMPREHTFSSPENVGVLFNIMIDVSGSLTLLYL